MIIHKLCLAKLPNKAAAPFSLLEKRPQNAKKNTICRYFYLDLTEKRAYNDAIGTVRIKGG